MDNSIRIEMKLDWLKKVFTCLTLMYLLSYTCLCYGKIKTYEPEKADLERGYFIYEKPTLEQISPSYLPVPREIIRNKISFCASLDEYAPITFSIYALKEFKDVNISVTDLRSGGNIIQGSAVDLRIVKCWKQRDTIEKDKEVIIPELLVKDDRLVLKGYLSSMPLTSYVVTDIPVNTSKQIWLTVKTSKSTIPGNYSGAVIIKPGNGPETRLELNLEVLPIKLLPPSKSYSIYYTGSSFGLPWYVPGVYPDMKTWEEQCRKDLKAIKEYGFQYITTYAPIIGSSKNGKLVLDLSNLGKSLQFHKEAGFTGFTPYIGDYSKIDGKSLHYRDYCKTEEDRKLFFYTIEKVTSETEAFVKQQFDGSIKLFYYGIDEANRNPKRAVYKDAPPPDYAVGVCKEIYEAIHRGGGLTTAAAYRSIADGGFDILGPLNDLPAYNYGSVYPGVSPEEIKKEAGSKKEVWTYWQPWEENPKQNRLLAGFMLWKSGFTGIAPYCSWLAGGGNDPYDEFSGKRPEKNMFIAYPSLEGPIPTLQSEALREGINDVRYLTTLTELIKQEKDTEKARRAQDVIDKILNRISINLGEVLFDISESDLNDFRAEIIHAIMELSDSKTKLLEIPKLSKPLVFNSKLKDIIMHQKLKLPLSETRKIIENKTLVYMGYDDVYLYLAFDCSDSDMDKLVSDKMNKRDGEWEWGDDGIEIFLDPGATGKSYYHLLVNAKGLLCDNYYSSVQNRNIGWDSNTEVKSNLGKEGWTTEIKIPWANIAADTVLPSLWGVNAGRWEPRTCTCQTWALLMNGNFHRPSQFNKVQFNFTPGNYCCELVKFNFGTLSFGNNILTAEIRNNSSEKLDLKAEVKWEFDGCMKSEHVEFSVNPAETKKISLPYKVECKGKDGKLVFNVINLRNNFLCLQKVKFFTVPSTIVKLEADPVSYLSEEQIKLRTIINLSDSDRNNTVLRLSFLAKDKIISKQDIILPSHIIDIPLQTTQLPPGLYSISAELFNEQKQLIETQEIKIKRINNPF
ncbi:MAG: sugar-binding protein [Victivallaceae bacterium]|nr:sugar-binding protein [Victivallaceae bacterium]